MPLGAFRLNSLAKFVAAAIAAGRDAITVTAVNNAEISTDNSKFGGASMYTPGGTQMSTANYIEANLDHGIGTGDFTIEWWCKWETPAATHMFSLTDSSLNVGFEMRLDNSASWRLYEHASAGSTFNIILNSNNEIYAYQANWNHFAWVRESGTIYLYVNGTKSSVSASYTTDLTNATIMHIGAGIKPTYPSMNGYMDEVRVSNTARYTASFTPPTSGFTNDSNTLLLLHMDGPDGSTTFTDDVGRPSVTVAAVNNAQVDTAQSKFGGASAKFDGVNDWLEVTNMTTQLAEIGTNDWTYELWFKTSDTTFALFDNRILNGDTSGTMAILAGANGDGKISLYYDNGFRATGATTVNDNSWHHFAVVKNNNSIQMYIDGSAYGSSYADSTSHTLNNVIKIGVNFVSGYDYLGHIDEFRISSTARYTANFTPPTEAFTDDADTMLLLHMDGPDASTDFVDDYVVENSGTLSGSGAAWDSYDGTANGSYTQIVNGDADAPAYGVVMFDDTYGIFVYGDEGNKSVRYHKLTVSGTSVTVGSAVDTGIDYDNITRMLPLKLSSTRAIVHCPYDANSGYVAIIDNSSGTLSHTTRNITSIGNTPNSIVSAVRLSDSNWALAGRKSGQPQVMAHYSIDGSNNITGGVTQGMTDFDQFMYPLPIDSDTVMIVGRNNSNTSKHSVGVYNWSGSAWSRSGSLVDVQTHSGYHVSRQFTQPNTHNVKFFGYLYAQTAGDVGIEIIPVAYNSGTPSVGSGFQISDSALESIAVPETNEQQYYAVNLHVVQPDPENAPNLFVAYYEIRQSDNRTGRSHIIIPMEYNSSTNTVTKAATETVLNGRGYAYGYIMTPLMAVADANTIVAVSHENDHTRNASVNDYDIGVIVIKDA